MEACRQRVKKNPPHHTPRELFPDISYKETMINEYERKKIKEHTQMLLDTKKEIREKYKYYKIYEIIKREIKKYW